MSRLFQRSQIAFVHDVTMAAVSLPAALYLRVGDGVVFYNPQNILFSASVFTVIAAVSFWFLAFIAGFGVMRL